MFLENIERSINGVVKVQQDDLSVVDQEVQEYVVTKELKKHFVAFFNRYVDAFEEQTADVGVWISGFFGSGKSHFLKILSYLLENREINGKKTAERFRVKFDDPGTYALVDRAVKTPAETILFNIDVESPMKKDDSAVLRVFAKTFYKSLGFYGDNLKVALLEQYLWQEGKLEEFSRTFEEKKGKTWLEQRKALTFNKKQVVSTLGEVLGIPEGDAASWLKEDADANYSVARFVDDVKKYVDSKPKDFRLLFMIDEVGQFVGDKTELLLNLQSIVEELGSKCNGKVWVVCTGQEAIDEMIKVREHEFSRIRARFKTCLSLSSSSVDEVIQKRVLQKKKDVLPKLEKLYEKNDSVLRNLFVFSESKADVKGFSNAQEFVDNFPFVPYQFRVMQEVFGQIRKHGAVGKHMSGGERSMLSGFQEAAKAIKDRDERALVPFYLFYDSVHEFLDGSIRRVFERCQTAAENGDGIKQFDVSVLKLLYLIRYIDSEIAPNLDNIVVLMADEIQVDKIALRVKTAEALDRLLTQNYVGKNGGRFYFLTDEEQDVQREINNVVVDSGAIVQRVASILYDDIYVAKKYRRGIYDFPFERLVDARVHGAPCEGVKLRFLTPDAEENSKNELALIRSSKLGQAIFVPQDASYFALLERAEKIRKYAKSLNLGAQPVSKQNIVKDRQREAEELERTAKEKLEEQIVAATLYVDGECVELKENGAKARIDKALDALVSQVYSELDLVKQHFNDDAQIREILATKKLLDVDPNEEASAKILGFLQMQTNVGKTTTMADVQRAFQGAPYGWREIDVAAIVARLLRDQKIAIKKAGETILASEPNLPSMLRKSTETSKSVVAIRRRASEIKIKKARNFLNDYFVCMDVPKDEDGLREYVVREFKKRKESLEERLRQYVGKNYPDKEILERSIASINEILALQTDALALISGVVDEADKLTEEKEDAQGVEDFFDGSKRQIFDGAVETLEKFRVEIESGYYANEKDATEAIETLRSLLDVSKRFNYDAVPKYGALLSTIREAHNRLIQAKRAELSDLISQCVDAVKIAADNSAIERSDVRENAARFFENRIALVEKTDDLVLLDGFAQSTIKAKDEFCRQIEERAKIDDTLVEPKRIETPKKYVARDRQVVFKAAILESEEDVDAYLAEARTSLTELLKKFDGVELN